MQERPLSTKQIQEAEYEVLKRFSSYCDEHELRYYLCGGTLLGAIRHNGFIPWDDDIDVMMPRPDFMRFLEFSRKESLGEAYAIDDYYYHKDFAIPGLLCRVYNMKTDLSSGNYDIQYPIGCAMDISVIDGVPASKLLRWIHFKTMFFLSRIHSFCITKKSAILNSKLFNILNIMLRPVRPVLKAVGLHNYQRWMDALCRKYSYDDCEYIGVINGTAGVKETMKKADMEPPVTVTFEGENFTAMANYKEYLTNLYGDYMTPPPENKRTPRHRSEVFWRDLSEMDPSEKWWMK